MSLFKIVLATRECLLDLLSDQKTSIKQKVRSTDYLTSLIILYICSQFLIAKNQAMKRLSAWLSDKACEGSIHSVSLRSALIRIRVCLALMKKAKKVQQNIRTFRMFICYTSTSTMTWSKRAPFRFRHHYFTILGSEHILRIRSLHVTSRIIIRNDEPLAIPRLRLSDTKFLTGFPHNLSKMPY